MYPFNVIAWVRLVLLSGAMSVSLGAVYLGLRWRYWDSRWQEDPIFEQDSVDDRIGFHYVFMCVGVWPTLLASISEDWRAKPAVTRDVEDRLYSKATYLFTKVRDSEQKKANFFPTKLQSKEVFNKVKYLFQKK